MEIIQLNYFDKEGDCELLVSLQIFFSNNYNSSKYGFGKNRLGTSCPTDNSHLTSNGGNVQRMLDSSSTK